MVASTRNTKRKDITSDISTIASKSKRVRTDGKSKQQAIEVIVIADSGDEGDDLQDILAVIRSNEESERLARNLQQQDLQIIDLSHDDDAELARRLADEWAKEDDIRHNASSSTSTTTAGSSSSTHAKAFSHVHENESSCNVSGVMPDEELATYRTLFTSTKQCPKCNGDVKSPRGCVTFSNASLPPSLLHLLHTRCNTCKISYCRGCFTPTACPRKCPGPEKNPECPVLTCCAEVRAIAIFETLGALDRQLISERAEADLRALKMASTNQPKSNTVGPGGTGYGRDPGYDYTPYSYSSGSKGKGKAKKGAELKFDPKKIAYADNIILRALELLVQLLPSPYDENPQVYDLLPHASVGHLLSLSQLPTLLTGLLRNDSVTDWIVRKEIYNAMLSLLRRMASCELSIQCLISKRSEMVASCGIEEWIWEEGQITWKKSTSGQLETLPPLYTYFKKLTTQSEAFLAGAKQMLHDAVDDEIDETIVQGTSLCGDIIAARDDLERAIAVLDHPSAIVDRDNRADQAQVTTHSRQVGKGKGRDLAARADKAYEEACEKLCFKYISLAEDATATGEGLSYVNFKYASHLTQTQNSTRHPKGRLHLLKELAVTATSLPPGVWVRVDEVRNDAIKIMIAGPEGTPYAGGLFEFDCCIPIEYPNSPPLMHLRTTGGGSVRFNPNLYNCGKVCLSLLGTWPGRPEEQWSPKSTLLQVLVSIQSMILIDAPYYNEPGHGPADVKAPVSIAYNQDISIKTMQWAIVDWLQDKHRRGIWRDVIKTHFIIRHDKIRQQLVNWSKAGGSHRGFFFEDAPYSAATGRTSSAATKGVELLAKFDKGMERIKSWKSDGDEEN